MKKFQEIIQQDQPVLVDFYASWCGTCKLQETALNEVKDRMGEEVNILVLDVEVHQDLVKQFKIRSIPTLIIFKQSEIRWRQTGVFPANELERLLRESLD